MGVGSVGSIGVLKNSRFFYCHPDHAKRDLNGSEARPNEVVNFIEKVPC
jgi:hypothetical protein